MTDILVNALRGADDKTLHAMLDAAEKQRMPYGDVGLCFATRLYGMALARACILGMSTPGAAAMYEITALAYRNLPCWGDEYKRQCMAAALIRAEINRRTGRAAVYFSAAEDEAWFLLSLSRKPPAVPKEQLESAIPVQY